MQVLKNKKVMAGIFVVVIVVGYLFYSGFRGSMIYYYKVGEILAQKDTLMDKGIRISGKVLEGSVNYDTKTLQLDFIAFEEGAQIPVRYTGVIPDTFKEGEEVVLEGKLSSAGVFEATNILVKCPSKYEVKLK